MTTFSTIARTSDGRWPLRFLGAGLLIATGSIHLDLYLTGYRHIPTIGALFLLQVISAFVLALLVLIIPRRIVALAGAGFALSTLGGYVMSLWFGLFGFNEIRTTAGIVAGILEVSAFVVLASYAALVGPALFDSKNAGAMARRATFGLGALGVLALVLAVMTAPSGSTGQTSATAYSGSASTTSIKVSIRGFAFVPATFSVEPGTKIIVTNDDGVTHTFTAKPGSSPLGTFNSGNIDPGATVTVTAPMEPGAYAYFCAIHNHMTGKIIVK